MLSDKVKSFLLENNIYSIEELKKLSLNYITSLSGYVIVKNEIYSILNENHDGSTISRNESNVKQLDNNLYKSENDIAEDHSTEYDKIDSILKLLNESVFGEVLSMRAYNICYYNNIETFRDLISLSEIDFLEFPNAGRKTLNEMIEILNSKGLYFGTNFSVLDQRNINQYTKKEILEKMRSRSNRITEIHIPEYSSYLSIKSILLLFDGIDLNKSYGSLERIKNNFTYLGDLDGHTELSLIQIKNIGRNVCDTLKLWYRNLASGSFSEIANKFSDFSDVYIENISCSPFLRDYLNSKSISTIEQISKIDEFQFAGINQLEKLCLLELRTISTDGNNLFTKSNCKGTEINLIRWIDEFVKKYCIKDWKEYLIIKWNDGIKTLNEVGEIKGVTRERVRQIIRQKIKNLFIDFYVYDYSLYEELFLYILKTKLDPIGLSDLINDNYEPQYSETFYLGFLNTIFPKVAFSGFNPKTYHSKRDVFSKIYELAKIPNNLKLYSYLENKSLQQQLDVFSVLFRSKYFVGLDKKIREEGLVLDLTKFEKEIYINPRKASLISSLISIFEEKDRPISLDEACTLLEKSDYLTIKVNKDSVYNTLNRLEETVVLDWHVWGLRRHFSYPEIIWGAIQNDCIKYLNELGHQAGAKFIYTSIKGKHPKIRSKYELVHILRASNEIVDLGFFNFATDAMKIEERLKVTDIIVEIFQKDKSPKSLKEIYNKISQVRTVRPEGAHGIFKQIVLFNYYRPRYYGLKSRHSKNLQELITNTKYVYKFVRNEVPNTNLEHISEYFEIDNSKLLDMINDFENLLILKDDYSNNHYVISKNWSLKQKIKTIVFNNSEPLTITEIKWTLNTFNKQITNKQISDIVRDDLSYTKDSSGCYLYSDLIARTDELKELMTQIEDYLSTLDQTIEIDELYNLVFDLTSDLKNKNHLIKLINLNDRIILHNNMVGLFDDN